jgi:GNAT superfamily N-acetyltransferase
MLKRIARAILGDYNIYRIYRADLHDVPPGRPLRYRLSRLTDFDNASDPGVKKLSCIAFGPEACAFGAWDNDALIAVCCVWYGQRYKTSNFWPLADGEAKLIQITVAESHRGRGVAPNLIRFAASEIKSLGFSGLYAKIWRSHTSSISAFERAGWVYVALLIDIYPLGIKRRLRLVRKKNARGRIREH